MSFMIFMVTKKDFLRCCHYSRLKRFTPFSSRLHMPPRAKSTKKTNMAPITSIHLSQMALAQVGGRNDHRGADEGAEEGAHAPDQYHHDDVATGLEVNIVDVGELNVHAV